jgi:low temperature requirement protein LtrA
VAEASSRPVVEPAGRVSTLELFFDLVFVFTITQMTALLAESFTVGGLIRVVVLLGVTSWMYGGYAWLTNAVSPSTRFRRTFFLVGMGGFMTMALAVPDAFGSTGWLFGLGYFVVNLVHSGLFLASGGPGAVRAMSRLGPLNLFSATVVLVGGLLPVPWRYALWIAAMLVFVISPYVNPINEFRISPAHFVERHGLIIIIALGESIVAIGVGLAGVTVDARVILVAALGLTLSYLMWWVYFGGDDVKAEHALAAAPPSQRGRLAIAAYGWAHYFLLLGIVVVSAGVKKAAGHATDHLTIAQALGLGGGLAIYLLADAWFRRILRIGAVRFRIAAALIAIATLPLGVSIASLQILALCLLLGLMLTIEARRTMPRSA